MTLEQLTILLELSQTHSMSRCAENLNMTKTNISKSISQLENELSVRLFFKSRQGSFLTPLGEQVCSYAARMLEDKKQIEKLCQTAAPAAKALNIMFTEAYAFLIPDITDSFRKMITDTSILHLSSLPAAHSNQIINMVEPDVAFCTLLTNELSSLAQYEDNYFIYKIYDEPMALMIDKNNLAEEFSDMQISIKQLKKFSLLVITNEVIMPDNTIEQSAVVESFLKQHDLYHTANIIQSNSLLLFKEYIHKPYYGILCDPFSMKHSSFITAEDFAFLTIKPICSVSRVILLNKNSPYLNLISEVLFEIQNRFEDDFPYLKNLNGMFGENGFIY